MASSLLDTLFGLCAGSFATVRIERMRTFKHFKSLPSSPDKSGSVNTATETWAGEVGGTIIGEIQGWQSIRKPWEVPNFGIIFRHRLSPESSSLRDPSSQHSSCDRFSNSFRSQPQCPSSSSTINHGQIERLRAFNQRFRRSLPSQLSAYLASNSVEQKRDIKDGFTTSSGPIKVDEREKRLSEEQLAACPRPDMLKIWPTRSPVELAKKLAQKEALPEEQRRQNELRAARFGRRGVKAGRGRQVQTGFRPREPTRRREFVPSGPIGEARREIERRFAAANAARVKADNDKISPKEVVADAEWVETPELRGLPEVVVGGDSGGFGDRDDKPKDRVFVSVNEIEGEEDSVEWDPEWLVET